jgi:hypothetical protein
MFDIPLFLYASSSAYFVSNLNAYTREIADGGVANRIWSFVAQFMFLGFAFSPLKHFFPEQSLLLNAIYYPLAGILGGINYVATICHQNQFKRNQHREAEIQKLPFNLHNNKIFNKAILWLSKYARYGILAFYGISVIAGFFLGSPLFLASAGCIFFIDQCRQQRWFPAFLQKSYLLLGLFLMSGQLFGFTSLLATGISLIFVAYSIWDYVQIHVKGRRSANSTFPTGTASHEFTLQVPIEPTASCAERLQEDLAIARPRTIRVTFNHFPAAIAISDRLLKNTPVVDFNQYCLIFCSLNLDSPELRDTINNEMVEHGKFQEHSYSDHAQSLGLAANASETDIQFAFLKREMSYLVQRLKSPSYRDLNHEQITTLQNQARCLLAFLNSTQDENARQTILFSLALRTGSHCNRVYLDTFAELNQQYSFAEQPSLSLRDQAVFMAQSIREDCFRTYYYEFVPQLHRLSPFYKFLFQDVNDYHTYEFFTSAFGSGYCLRNKSLNVSFRSPLDTLLEEINLALYSNIGRTQQLKTLFSDYYNAQRLVKEILEGKLHPIFMKWCEERYPGTYRALVLDEETTTVKVDDPDVIALAKLMLLDFKMVEFTEAFQPIPAQTRTTIASRPPHVSKGLFPPEQPLPPSSPHPALASAPTITSGASGL